jgi:dihydrofolate reductase
MLALIAAKSRNNVIGVNGKMPWRQDNDLQRFKALTYGHTVIMGRKTYDSIRKPLPGRSNYVVTRNISPFLEINNATLFPGNGTGASVYGELDQAIENFHKARFPYHMHLETGFVIGGGELYAQCMDKAHKLYITEIECDVENGDAFFPEIDPTVWKKIAEEKYKADDRNQFDYNFCTYTRIPVIDKSPGWNIS